MLRNEWHKVLDVPILSRQWEIRKWVNEPQIMTYTIKIIIGIYWTALHLYRKGLTKTTFCWNGFKSTLKKIKGCIIFYNNGFKNP